MNNINPIPIKQKGGASIVFVLLMSLVVLASTTKAFKDVKNTQEIGTAVNSLSHAESGTKFAAEAFRLYLQSLSTNAIRTLQGSPPISITADHSVGTLTAENISVVEPSPEVFEVTTTFINRHQAARSSAKLQVVYDVVNAPPPSTGNDEIVTINFTGNVDLTGNVEILNNKNPVDLVVDGDLDIGGVSLSEINDIFATGSVTIGSNETVRAIFANDDVLLKNTEAVSVRTMGSVKTEGDAEVSLIEANGDVNIGSFGNFDQIDARGHIDINSGRTIGRLTSGKNINISNAGSVESAQAIGNVNHTRWINGGIDRSLAMGDVNCVPGWTKGISAIAGGTADCQSTPTFSVISGATNIVTLPEEITPLSTTPPAIDVWAVRDLANYFVQYDAGMQKITVTVKNVEELIDDHVYILGTIPAQSSPWKPAFNNVLCETIDASGNCSSPTQPTLPICFGGYPGDPNCITYVSNTNTFTFTPSHIAPGIVFVDGNVSLRNGHSFTTLLASGNITTDGNFKHDAANSGGYQRVCEGDASNTGAPTAITARFEQAYSKHYPTNLCDKANGNYKPTPTGNIAFAAGGFNPDTSVNPSGGFSGGDIDLGGSTSIVGAVIAGNSIVTNSGHVTIKGLVSAGGQANNGASNNIAAKTIIDFDSNDDYDPLDIPDFGVNTAAITGPPMRQATMRWIRPL